MTRRNWTKWGLVFLGWTLIGLFFGSQFYLASALGFGMPTVWYRAFATGLADWYIWGALAPLVFWLCRRFRLGRGFWTSRLLLHLFASIFISLLQLVVTTAFAQLLESSSGRAFPFLAGLQFALVVKFHWNMVIYWSILGFSHALAYYRESRERALQALQLESQLAQARLQALKMQLNPHFLFNTLNTISQLIYEEPENADSMIIHLGELLRLSLEGGGEHQVTLRRELEFLERYLAIQKARFGDRLTTDFSIEPDVYNVLVPTLILQPLVENAIRHGIGPRSTPGRIDIHARRQNQMLCIQVSDNGLGLPEGDKVVSEGVGLSNTRARMEQLYGMDQNLTFSKRPDGGLVVTLTLPLQISPLDISPTIKENNDGHPHTHR